MIQVWANYSNGCGYYLEGNSKEEILSTASELVRGTGRGDPTVKSEMRNIHNEYPKLKVRGLEANERTRLVVELNEALKIA